MGRKSDAWLRERSRDYYRRKALEEGYRSRAAYKLIEAASKRPLLGRGFKILDLGSAPGGWLQVASEKTGRNGLAIGVDKRPIAPFKSRNVKIILMDVKNPQLTSVVLSTAKGKLHTVLSDLSPNISGVWETDSEVQMDLAETALRIAVETLKPGGCFFVKLFQGPRTREFYRSVKNLFEEVSYFKPKASKSRSSEMYIMAISFKPKASTRT
ncbi:MAG: RlmE family RNA methyltransferase [Candidatus Bathyarchaeia archaeon]